MTSVPSTEKCSSDSSGLTEGCARIAAMTLRRFGGVTAGCTRSGGRPEVVVYSAADAEFARPVFETFTETTGVVLKCDTIGSLEAITDLLKKARVPIRMADIGHITRRDVVEAAAVRERKSSPGWRAYEKIATGSPVSANSGKESAVPESGEAKPEQTAAPGCC